LNTGIERSTINGNKLQNLDYTLPLKKQ